MLWSLHFSIAYAGFGVPAPHIAYGVEARLRYSSAEENYLGLRDIEARYSKRLQNIENESTLPFNKMSEPGEDGHIKDSAPVYTPFTGLECRMNDSYRVLPCLFDVIC